MNMRKYNALPLGVSESIFALIAYRYLVLAVPQIPEK
jgi:hypothetical protein